MRDLALCTSTIAGLSLLGQLIPHSQLQFSSTDIYTWSVATVYPDKF